MAVATFWIALAAVIIVAALNGRRTQELKHETLRLLLERGEKVEPDLLRDLLRAPRDLMSPPPDSAQNTYTALRIAGTILLCIAPGLATMLGIVGYARNSSTVQLIGLGVAALIALVGIGLHLSCRYLPKPSHLAP